MDMDIWPRNACRAASCGAQLFGDLSHPLRLALVRHLLAVGEECVCSLSRGCRVDQPTLSRHLRILKDHGVVTDRREGAKAIYRVIDPRGPPSWIPWEFWTRTRGARDSRRRIHEKNRSVGFSPCPLGRDRVAAHRGRLPASDAGGGHPEGAGGQPPAPVGQAYRPRRQGPRQGSHLSPLRGGGPRGCLQQLRESAPGAAHVHRPLRESKPRVLPAPVGPDPDPLRDHLRVPLLAAGGLHEGRIMAKRSENASETWPSTPRRKSATTYARLTATR